MSPDSHDLSDLYQFDLGQRVQFASLSSGTFKATRPGQVIGRSFPGRPVYDVTTEHGTYQNIEQDRLEPVNQRSSAHVEA